METQFTFAFQSMSVLMCLAIAVGPTAIPVYNLIITK